MREKYTNFNFLNMHHSNPFCFAWQQGRIFSITGSISPQISTNPSKLQPCFVSIICLEEGRRKKETEIKREGETEKEGKTNVGAAIKSTLFLPSPLFCCRFISPTHDPATRAVFPPIESARFFSSWKTFSFVEWYIGGIGRVSRKGKSA